MTAPVLGDLPALDRMLVEALADLRTARIRSAHHSGRESLLAQERAEANLNALLDHRFASRRRQQA